MPACRGTSPAQARAMPCPKNAMTRFGLPKMPQCFYCLHAVASDAFKNGANKLTGLFFIL
jgi:hypothetical protein